MFHTPDEDDLDLGDGALDDGGGVLVTVAVQDLPVDLKQEQEGVDASLPERGHARRGLTSSSSSPTVIRPSLPAAPPGSMPTTNTLMRERSLFPARLRPRPVLPFSSSIMCRTPGRLP